MFDTVIEMLSYPFMTRAFLVGSLVALCSALLGVSLVLKRYSMIGDGLSHVGFGAMAIAAAMNAAPLTVAIPVVIVAAILLLRISGNAKIKGDAAIAMISVGALAVGYLLMNVFSTGSNISGDVCSSLFGSTSILTLTTSEVWLCVVVSVIVVALFTVFYHKIFAVTFDESFAKATGVNVSLYNVLIAVLTAITIVIGMRMMGAMLISSLVIFPALTAMTLLRSFRGVVICAAGLSVVCFCVGLTGSYLWGTPVGATVVLVNLAAFLLSRGVMKLKRAS